jgi:platelet-activating factor acetylhydrolase IB subunit alpha
MILEKKWTSVVRLQRKVLDLEAQITSLKDELENSSPGTRARSDPESWLPRSPPKYSMIGHRQPITSIAFHPIFSIVASASEDGTIKVWDWELGELERTVKAHTKSVLDVDFGGVPGDILLASCSSDLTIKLWDPQNDYSNIRTLTGHDHTISSVRFTPSGTHLISASRDKTIRIWEVKTGYSIRTIRGHSEWVKSIAPSPDGLYILSGGIDQSARLSTFMTGEGRLLFVGHDHVIEHVVFAPPTSYRYLCALEGLKKPVESSFSSSFEYVATASRDKTIKIWNTRQEVIATLVGHDNWVRALVFHPGGKYLISASDDRTIRCWDLSQNGRCVKTIQDAHQHFVSCIRWAPPISNSEGKEKSMRCLLATGSVDMELKIWT